MGAPHNLQWGGPGGVCLVWNHEVFPGEIPSTTCGRSTQALTPPTSSQKSHWSWDNRKDSWAVGISCVHWYCRLTAMATSKLYQSRSMIFPHVLFCATKVHLHGEFQVYLPKIWNNIFGRSYSHWSSAVGALGPWCRTAISRCNFTLPAWFGVIAVFYVIYFSSVCLKNIMLHLWTKWHKQISWLWHIQKTLSLWFPIAYGCNRIWVMINKFAYTMNTCLWKIRVLFHEVRFA